MFNKGLPMTMRSIFYPLLGERIWGWPGHIIDILSVFATLFGLATSPNEKRMERMADYIEIFTGQPCRRRDMARFASRHTPRLAEWMRAYNEQEKEECHAI
ncbi:hypothetical protein FHR97_002973 [Halomonas stenophila]|uniref:Uncharacterized protein n=1 Tax=Halomonas stenophila TaxID=795312 RepID=A0A7W5HKR4_9GAMM|nr:hypothetical protein [Halomonas stenophila]